MRIEYIGHSGVLIELDNFNLLFDVIGFKGVACESSRGFVHDVGTLPDLDPSKETVVFVSHNHGDHYSDKIWQLRELYPNIKYIISKDVHFSSGVRQRLGISDAYADEVLRVKNYSSQDVLLPSGNSIHVQTIPATDEGVAFLVKVNGKVIYHAGDHHMWMWEANGQKYMDDMAQVFKRTLSRLELNEGETIDVAFLLLDGRLGNHAYDGIDTYLEQLPIKNVIPIHQWQEYTLTDAYLEARGGTLGDVKIHKVTGENCQFEI